MKRLLPFRDYNEHDVINMFALDTANTAIGDSGSGDSGVIVKVSAGAIQSDAVSYISAAYQGKTDFPNVGRNRYPEVPLKVTVAGSGAADCLGLTLAETALYDENGEKLTYYRQKALENGVLFSGQAVPVLTKGTVMLAEEAFVSSSVPAPGTRLTAGAGGKFLSLPVGATGAGGTLVGERDPVYGKVLATGVRVAQGSSDYYAGSVNETGRYALVRVDFQ